MGFAVVTRAIGSNLQLRRSQYTEAVEHDEPD
jgi:hypothetical protein